MQQEIKRWSKKRFFRASRPTTFSQSPMLTDGALKLDYASVIFVDTAVRIDNNLFSYHSWCVYKVSGGSYLSKAMIQRTICILRFPVYYR